MIERDACDDVCGNVIVVEDIRLAVRKSIERREWESCEAAEDEGGRP